MVGDSGRPMGYGAVGGLAACRIEIYAEHLIISVSLIVGVRQPYRVAHYSDGAVSRQFHCPHKSRSKFGQATHQAFHSSVRQSNIF